jgi:hypothetical protein
VGAAMTDEVLIKKIVTTLEEKLADMAIADHMDVLNALTELMINILKTAEYLSAPQAYRRAAEVFADAAVAEEAEAAEGEAKAKAAAEAKTKARPQPARRVLKMGKLEYHQLRQRRIAGRAAKRARTET